MRQGPRTKATKQAAIERCEKTRQIQNAIIAGIERGQDTYSKIYDRAIAIKVELQKAGFSIVRAPKKDGAE